MLHNYYPRCLLVAIAAVAVGGCPGGFEWLQPELPAHLSHVIDHPEEFDIGKSTSLDGLAPGTVRSDLLSLSGCWGVLLGAPDAVGPSAQVLRFDSAGGDFEEWSLATFGGIVVLTGRVGKFEILDESRILIRIEYAFGNTADGSVVKRDLEPFDVTALVTVAPDGLLFEADGPPYGFGAAYLPVACEAAQ